MTLMSNDCLIRIILAAVNNGHIKSFWKTLLRNDEKFSTVIVFWRIERTKNGVKFTLSRNTGGNTMHSLSIVDVLAWSWLSNLLLDQLIS